MKRSVLIALATLLLSVAPVSAAMTVLKEEVKAPTLVGNPSWGETVFYDFKDRNGQLVAHHHCSEVYEFYPDGGILHGPILDGASLTAGEEFTLDAWPSTSWAICSVHLIKVSGGGVAQTDLWYLISPQ